MSGQLETSILTAVFSPFGTGNSYVQPGARAGVGLYRAWLQLCRGGTVGTGGCQPDGWLPRVLSISGAALMLLQKAPFFNTGRSITCISFNLPFDRSS